MKTKYYISIALLFISILPKTSFGQENSTLISFDFYGNPVELNLDKSGIVSYNDPLSESSLQAFQKEIAAGSTAPLIQALLNYKKQYQLDDWFYYQLIRKTAQQISPKADNYFRYTLYKWVLLTRSGYDASLKISQRKLLLYVQSNDSIFNIPYYLKNGKQYVCLNYHDYGGAIDFENEKFSEVSLDVADANNGFSYKISHMPDFNMADYKDKDLQFNYGDKDYHFTVKLNPLIKTIFANYPAVEFGSYFNIPISKQTYESLIPTLKKELKGLNEKNGIDFLIHFTRNAFSFQPDRLQFGGEKRLSPEQTLLYDQSDCEDRAALFFFLVKEIYNLPMIVLSFPEHVTVAVKFDKHPGGKPIYYKGEPYYVCEPTPQKEDIAMGKLIPQLKYQPYEISYSYVPLAKK